MDPKELRGVVAGVFRRGRRRTMRVAVEQEFVVSDAATGGVVPIDRVRRAVRSPYVSFEPGGQLELSLPCSLDPARDLRRLTEDVRRQAAGIRLSAIPVDPRPGVPLQLTSPRYVAMQRHFDTIGPAGRRMMRRTASTQVCLDWWPGAAGLEQWRVLNLAGPFIAAAFAQGTDRLSTWLAVDPARTGFDDRVLYGDDPVAAYTDFAAGAAVFVDGGPAEHVTTLFPPVRPRGTYLEVRFLDAMETVDRVIAVLTRLMYDDDRRRDVLRQLEPGRLEELWRAAAAGDPAIADRGRELVAERELAA